jgi:hypothetical protein
MEIHNMTHDIYDFKIPPLVVAEFLSLADFCAPPIIGTTALILLLKLCEVVESPLTRDLLVDELKIGPVESLHHLPRKKHRGPKQCGAQSSKGSKG